MNLNAFLFFSPELYMVYSIILLLCFSLYVYQNNICQKANNCVKEILFKYYFNNILNQKTFLHISVITFLISLDFNKEIIIIYYVLIELIYITYRNNTIFAIFLLAYIAYICLNFEDLHIKFLFKTLCTIIIMWSLRTPKNIKKPGSFGDLKNALEIYKYHKSKELPVMFYVPYLCVIIAYIAIFFNFIELKLFFIFTLTICSLFSALNYSLSFYLNPIPSRYLKYGLFLAQLTSASTISCSALHLLSTTSFIEPPNFEVIKIYQRYHFGYVIDKQGLILRDLILLNNLQEPPVLNGVFNNVSANKILKEHFQSIALYAEIKLNEKIQTIEINHDIKHKSWFISESSGPSKAVIKNE